MNTPEASASENHDSPPEQTKLPVGLFRRLAIIVYDALLLTAVLFLAMTLLVFLNDGDAIGPDSPVKYALTQLYLLAMSFLYFGWFWTQGQTLGMRAWKTVVLTPDDKAISWGAASIRFALAIVSWAPAGLGFVWSLFDKDKRAWHDIGSRTRLVRLARQPAHPLKAPRAS